MDSCTRGLKPDPEHAQRSSPSTSGPGWSINRRLLLTLASIAALFGLAVSIGANRFARHAHAPTYGPLELRGWLWYQRQD